MSAGLLPGYTWDHAGMLKDGVRLPDSLVKAGETVTGVVENKVIQAGAHLSGSAVHNCVIVGSWNE